MAVSYRTATSMKESQLQQNDELANSIRKSVAYLKDVGDNTYSRLRLIGTPVKRVLRLIGSAFHRVYGTELKFGL